MTKRIMAMILTVVMIVSVGSVVMAAPPTTIKEVINNYAAEHGLDAGTWLNRNLDVPVDIEVKESDSSTWSDGPLQIKERSEGRIPTFDYKATLHMSVVRDTFDDYINTAKALIRTSGGDEVALSNELENTKVQGEFNVKITVPDGNFDIPDEVISGSNMSGFNEAAKSIFHEISRTAAGNVITVKLAVGGENTANADFATTAELKDYLGSDLVFVCEGIQPKAFGTYQVKGEVTGSTVIGDSIANISYKSEPLGIVGEVDHNPDNTVAPEVAATVVVSKKSSSSSTSSSNTGTTTVRVEFVVDGKIVKTVTGTDEVTLKLSDIIPEEKEGFEFDGWYLDEELTKKAPDTIKIDESTKLYAKYIPTGQSVEKDSHFAYIVGYTDGTVRPLDTITREEVAAIFFRLLEEKGEAIIEEVAPYKDVPASKWSSTAIATLSKAGLITGRDDGTFRPEDCITRAEFAAIVARFGNGTADSNTIFSDVEGHWAENYIAVCAANGWITGYEDGTFKPDQYITRAEAMAIINRMLGRAVDAEGIVAVEKDIYKFSDNQEGTWYYYIVLEATNSHEYECAEGENYETWTSVIDIRDWTAYEK